VNGKTVDIPSYLVKEGDEIAIRHKELPSVKDAWNLWCAGVSLVAGAGEGSDDGQGQAFADKEDISIPIKEQLIVEYYSR